jgi:hypothetical protein
MRRPCRAIDRSRGVRGTAGVAGLTQEFLRDHFEAARRDLLVALCRLGHRTRSSAPVWTCSAPHDRPPCCNPAPLNAPGSRHAIRVRHADGPPATTISVVRNRVAIDPRSAAPSSSPGPDRRCLPRTCRRTRRWRRSCRCPRAATRPFSGTTLPSRPALTAICISREVSATFTMAAPLASSPVSSASRRRCRRRSPARRHHPGARPPRSRLSAAGNEGQTRVGGQVQGLEVPATKTTRKYNRDATRTTDLLPGQHRTGSRQEPPGARFGGIPLTRQRTATLTDLKPVTASSNPTS